MASTLKTISKRIRRRLFAGSMPVHGNHPVSYEKYWQKARGSYSERFVDQICREFDFDTVLDGGSGDGGAIRAFLKNGKQATGVEYSGEAISRYCSDLQSQGHVMQGSLMDLPFDDHSFDLVFSSEVLEHIEEDDAERAVRELVRVAKKHLFLTISLRPSSDNNRYHVNLKPRAWWQDLFQSMGCVTETDLVNQYQVKVPGASMREIMEKGPTSAIMDELGWFIDTPPYDLQGELEPWFFIFTKRS